MGIYRQLYEFAANAGAFEGYVYPREKVDPSYLPRWASNLVKDYARLPDEVRGEFQDLCDGTLGRAIRALIPLLGEDHEVIEQLRSLTQGRLPSSPDDFSRGA